MKVISKLIQALLIGDNDKPVNLAEIIKSISSNFSKSPQTTIAGLVIVIIGTVILLTRPELETLGFALIGGGFSLLGVRDVWSKKNTNQKNDDTRK